MAALIISIVAVITIVVVWFIGLNEAVGSFLLDTLFPITYPVSGDQVEIFINGTRNRRATVTACCFDFIVLYDAIQCPVDYRGRFYAIGEDLDGNSIVYVDTLEHYRLVRRAELIRKVCKVHDDYGTFTPFDDNRPLRDILKGIKDAEHPDPEKSEISMEGIE